MKAIVFDQGINIKEVVEKPLPKDYYLAQPIKVLLNAIENAIYLGLLWVEPKRILGTFGMLKILKSGLESDKNLEGRYVISIGYSKKYGGIGSEIDGIMAEKVIIPNDAVVSCPDINNDKLLLYPHASIALQIEERILGDDILIVGYGILTFLLVNTLRDKVRRISIFREYENSFKIEGVEIIKEPKRQWDTLIITSMKSWIRVYIRELTKENGKVIIPRFLKTWPSIIYTDNNRRVEYIEPEVSNKAIELLNKFDNKTFSQLISYSNDPISSIPTITPGIIINFESHFGNI
jgi:hypothetical protein